MCNLYVPCKERTTRPPYRVHSANHFAECLAIDLFGNHGRMNETNREMMHSGADSCQRAVKLKWASSAWSFLFSEGTNGRDAQRHSFVQ